MRGCAAALLILAVLLVPAAQASVRDLVPDLTQAQAPIWPSPDKLRVGSRDVAMPAGHAVAPTSPRPAGTDPGEAAVDPGSAGVAGTAAYLLLRLLLPLSTRRSSAQVLDHPLRSRLHAALAEVPGSSVAELAALVGVSRTTVTYHVRVLEHAGALWSRREGRVRRCYLRGQPAPAPGARSALGHPNGHALASIVAAAPGVTLSDAARGASLSRSLASWHLSRLVAAGVLRRERRGVRVRFYPAPGSLA